MRLLVEAGDMDRVYTYRVDDFPGAVTNNSAQHETLGSYAKGETEKHCPYEYTCPEDKACRWFKERRWVLKKRRKKSLSAINGILVCTYLCVHRSIAFGLQTRWPVIDS